MPLTIKAKLLAVLACLSTAVLAAAAAGWIGIGLNNAAFRSVHDDRVVPLKQIKTVSDMYAVTIVDTAHKVRNGTLDWQAGAETVKQALRDSARQWNDYLGSELTAEETNLVADAAERKATADVSAQKLAALLAAQDQLGLEAYVIEELYPSIDPLTRQLGRLVDLQLRVASAEFSRAQNVSIVGRWILALLTALSLGAVGLGAWVTIAGVSRPLSTIAAAITHLARGDFTVSVPGAERRDEIGTVAKSVEILRDAARLNEELQAEKQRQHDWMCSVLDELPLGVTVFDDEQRVVYRNRAMNRLNPHPNPESLIGRTLDELIGKVISETPAIGERTVDAEAQAREIVAKYRAQKEGQFEMHLPTTGVTAAARFRWIDGKRLVIVQADVSELRAAQRAAEDSARRLKEAINALPVSFALMGKDQTLQLYNEEFVREFDFMADKIHPAMTVPEFMEIFMERMGNQPTFPWTTAVGSNDFTRAKTDPRFRKQVAARLAEEYVKAGSISYDVERINGAFRIRQSTLASGETVRAGLNITDLRQKEAEIRRLGESALAQRTAILHEVLNAVPQAIAVLDSEHRLTFGNSALAEALGKAERSEGFDRLPLDTVLEALKIDPAQASPLFAGDRPEIELTSRDFRPLRLHVTPVPSGDVLLAITDLSQQRQQEVERLEQQQRLLRAEKSQALVTLAGSIAHDFNNLLAVIVGFTTIAADSAKALSGAPGLKEPVRTELSGMAASLGKVITSAERGRAIVASLNVLGKDRPEPDTRVDLRQVLTDSEPLLRVLFPASARLAVRLPKAPCFVATDPIQIEQVVTNLGVNAVHALDGRAGHVTVSLETVDVDGRRADRLKSTEAAARRTGSHVEVHDDGTVELFAGILKPGRHVQLQVTDDGSGMDERVARNILTPFFTTKETGRGTGLGLVSVLEIVTTHQGAIHIRTRKGAGTSFMVLFPEAAATVEPAARAPLRTRGAQSVPPGKAGAAAELRTDTRIIVVDDETLLVDLATGVLRRNGYEVEGFTDAPSALRRIADEPQGFDLVVTDQTMPAMTGVEFIERLRSIRDDLPVIICTGLSASVQPRQKLPACVRSILHKPYTPSELATAVQHALAAA